jgi:hypothetical protein
MTDWKMLVERWNDRQNFPKFTSDEPGGPRRFTTTLKYLRAWRGQFTFQDHDAPWSVVAPNIDITMGNLPKYHGTASFSGGTVAIQQYQPFSASMSAEFVLDGPHVRLERIDMDTDGAKTIATGDVELGSRWPEQQYQFKSHVQFPRMRRIFFKDEKWDLSGDGDVAGTFHLFKNGRDLTANFSSPVLGVNEFRFPGLYGSVHWTPDLLDVTDAGAKFFGGDARFSYSLKPLGSKTPTVARFDTSFENADLRSFTEFEQLADLRFAGTVSGDDVRLEWPLGHFAEHRGSGRVIVTPPAGAQLMTASLASVRAADEGHAHHEWGPFAPAPLPRNLPVGGEVSFRFDPNQVLVESGRFVTERTHVTFQGTTAWGGESRLAFHVTSADWQESDQVLAGIMTDFGKPTGPVPFGGRGEFDGLMTGPFQEPRIEGEFTGEDLRAFDTMWGSGSAQIVVENNYVRVTDGAIRLNSSEMRFDGLFSLGYPRSDGRDEIDARIRVVRRDLDSLRHAFRIDEYPVTGLLSGEFRLTGQYERPIGFGGITLESFTAYGEPFQSATASLRFDGSGVRVDGINAPKGGGTITGAAYVGWDATYSFNFDGRRIPVEQISRLSFRRAALTGIAEFSAAGSGTFDAPRNDYHFRVNDLFIGEEGIGQVTATLALRGTELSGEIDAASPRLAITASGRIAMTTRNDADVTVRFHDMSLDPYVRPFVPRLSPFATAVASGSLRLTGQLSDVDQMSVAAQVDTVDLRLFDYALKNAAPIRMSLEKQSVRIDDLQLEGEDTRLRLSGSVGLRDERLALRAVGDANLGILQAFFRDVRSSGRAELTAGVDGTFHEPVFSGQASIVGGRIRHYSLPNSLDAINGILRFDANGVRLDELKAMMGGGDVQFGGRVAFDGAEPGELNVTMRGSDVQVRYPVGIRSVIDADLSLRGNYRAPTLGGTVTVKSAVYSQRVEETELFDFLARRARENGGVTGETAVATAAPLKFDITIEVPSTFRVQNNIARLTANASFTLRGTSDRPSWFGHADVLDRGEIALLGRRYRVTKGTIDLVNPVRFEPLFDFEGETTVRQPGQTYRVVVGFVGTPDRAPVLSLSSEPPLSSSADVLALLLSDVPRQDAPELRALQNPGQNATDILATQATSLLAQPISANVGRVVEQTLGIDTFQLTPTFMITDPTTSLPASRLNPTARLTIGKRISDRAYLTFSRSLASPINDQLLQLEYDATERWSWVLSRAEDSQTWALEFRVRHVF